MQFIVKLVSVREVMPMAVRKDGHKCWCGAMVAQLICNQSAVSSNLITSSTTEKSIKSVSNSAVRYWSTSKKAIYNRRFNPSLFARVVWVYYKL